MLELVVAVVLVLLFSAIASGTEAAIFSLPLSKAKTETGRIGKILSAVKDNPTRLISTIVIFSNLSNIVGTFIVAALASKVLSSGTMNWFPWFLTSLIIIFAEIIPKTLGERYSLTIAKFMILPMLVLTWILSPIVFLLGRFVMLFSSGTRPSTSESEIRMLATMGCEEGVIEHDEAEHLHRIFELKDSFAVDIMTPRTALTWLRGSDKLCDIKAKVALSQHSRIVVFGKDLDEVQGVLLKNKVLELLATNADESFTIDQYVEPVESFAEFTPADLLLEYFKKSRVHLVVVRDEYGGLSGIVTLEDVLEVLTGEIVDETDSCVDLQKEARKKGRNHLGLHHTSPRSIQAKPERESLMALRTETPEEYALATSVSDNGD